MRNTTTIKVVKYPVNPVAPAATALAGVGLGVAALCAKGKGRLVLSLLGLGASAITAVLHKQTKIARFEHEVEYVDDDDFDLPEDPDRSTPGSADTSEVPNESVTDIHAEEDKTVVSTEEHPEPTSKKSSKKEKAPSEKSSSDGIWDAMLTLDEAMLEQLPEKTRKAVKIERDRVKEAEGQLD